MVESVEIIEASEEAAVRYGTLYGCSFIKLKDIHIEALKNNKMLAWDDGEYSTFVMHEKTKIREKLNGR